MSALALLLALASSACSPDSSNDIPSTDMIRKEFNKAIEEFMERPERPLDELKKLHQLEYNVFSLPADSSTSKIEGALDEFGKNRWDCFQALTVGGQSRTRGTESKLHQSVSSASVSERLLFMCKRRPETLLKYVPKSMLGR